MNKNLYFKICSLAVGSFLLIWCIVFGIFMLKGNTVNHSPIPPQTAESIRNSVGRADIEHYLARAYNNKVIIYEVYGNGYEKAIGVPDISVSQMSLQDRAIFERGIVLETKEDVASLIEDFTS